MSPYFHVKPNYRKHTTNQNNAKFFIHNFIDNDMF